jgi:hypothetical protein
MRQVQNIITSGLGAPPRLILNGFNPVSKSYPEPVGNSTLILSGLLSTSNDLILRGLGVSSRKIIYSFNSPIINMVYEFNSFIDKKDDIITKYDIWL